jgi:hypothetical protein
MTETLPPVPEEGMPMVDIYPVPALLLPTVARMPDGKSLVLVVASTPLGPAHYFLEPELADATADMLKETARVAKTGIVIPNAAQTGAMTSADMRGERA